MSRRLALVSAGSVLFAAAFVPPAHAAGGTVEIGWYPSFSQKVGEGYLAGGVCAVRGIPGVGETTVAVTLKCSINSLVYGPQAFSGPFAARQMVSATQSPILMCVEGSAIFTQLNGTQSYTVSKSSCFVMPS